MDMKKHRESLDWSRLLGFEQIADRRGRGRIGSKIGDNKETEAIKSSVQ
jgi:hypothetical protein